MGGELRGQPGPGGGALEVLLVGATDDELVLAALEQVPVGRGAVPGNVLVDRLADVLRQRDVAELPLLPELQRLQLRCWVDLLLQPQGLAPVDPAAQVDRERLADPQSAAVHQPYSGGPVWRQPGHDRFYLRASGKDEVGGSDDAG